MNIYDKVADRFYQEGLKVPIFLKKRVNSVITSFKVIFKTEMKDDKLIYLIMVCNDLLEDGKDPEINMHCEMREEYKEKYERLSKELEEAYNETMSKLQI